MPSHLTFAEAPCCPVAGWQGDSGHELRSTSQAVSSMGLFGSVDADTPLPAGWDGAGHLLS